MKIASKYNLLNKLRGFSVVELLVIISIIAILASVSIVYYLGSQGTAYDATVVSDANSLNAAEKLYMLSKNSTSGKSWFSGSGSDTDLPVTLSTGNIADVVARGSGSLYGYCIRVYNTSSKTYSTIDTAYTIESAPGLCSTYPPSPMALYGVSNTGLVAYFDATSTYSYPGSGTTWKNLAGSNNATLSSSSIMFGGMAYFDGASSANFISTDNFATNQTIILVLKPTENDAVRRNPYGQAYGGYGAITHETVGNLSYYWGTSGTNSGTSGTTYTGYTSNSSLGSVAQNELAMVAVTRDQSFITWYKNNAVQAGQVSNIFPTTVNSLNTIYIGYGYSNYYQGQINLLALYTRTLTSSEISSFYNLIKSRFGLP